MFAFVTERDLGIFRSMRITFALAAEFKWYKCSFVSSAKGSFDFKPDNDKETLRLRSV